MKKLLIRVNQSNGIHVFKFVYRSMYSCVIYVWKTHFELNGVFTDPGIKLKCCLSLFAFGFNGLNLRCDVMKIFGICFLVEEIAKMQNVNCTNIP